MASSAYTPAQVDRLGPPHAGVYTRLRPSNIDPGGVGVFAIRDIKKGTYLFEPDADDMVWILLAEIAQLPPEIKRMYTDFAVKHNGSYGCPVNLNKLTISWYLNHSDRPNVGCDTEYKFYALRDIAQGEELSTDYTTYSDGEPLVLQK